MALQPLEVIPGDGGSPFAIHLKHGWAVSGPVHASGPMLEIMCNGISACDSSREIITPEAQKLAFTPWSSTLTITAAQRIQMNMKCLGMLQGFTDD